MPKASKRSREDRASALEELFEPFAGFPAGCRPFLAEVAKRQDRDWFMARREEYASLWHHPMQLLLKTLAERIQRDLPGVSEGRAKVFRIYRDTRFSADKTPYKSHVAGTLEGGHGMMFYVHLGIDEDVVAIGKWMLEPEVLTKMRDRIAAPATGAPFARAVAAAAKRGFNLHSHEQLKRVPAPFPADHPRADLLRRKGLSFGFPKWPRKIERSPEFVDWLADHARQIAPAVKLLEAVTAP